MLSEPGLVTYKTLTPQDREMMLAYADKCPRATLQAIAGRWSSHDNIEPLPDGVTDIFWVSKR